MIASNQAGVAPFTPGVWITTPPNGIISLLGGRLLVLSSDAEIAVHYTNHKPAANQFSLARPYQQPAPAELVPADQTIPTPPSDVMVPLIPTDVPVAGSFERPSNDESPAGSPHDASSQPGGDIDGNVPITLPRVRRKRKQGLARGPNVAEEQAMVRHSAFRPALDAAGAELQAWLGAATPAGQPPLLRFAMESQARRSGGAGNNDSSAGSSAAGPVRQRVPQLERSRALIPGEAADDGALPGAAPDGGMPPIAVEFAVLHQLKHVMRPKLTWGGASISAPQPPPRGRPPELPPTMTGGPPNQAVDPTGETPRVLAGRSDCEELRHSPSHRSCKLYDALIINHGLQDAAAVAAECPVVLPPESAFLMSDVSRLGPLMPGHCSQGFGLIVLDPPWENASAARGAKYASLPSRALLRLPLPELLHPGGALVAIWMTNRERHWRFVEAELLPAFQLTAVATWLWLKVTDGGEPDSEHRRPYEGLLLAHSYTASQSADWVPLRPPDQLVLAAVPGEHSRKPHLGRILRRYTPLGARSLEMFAREMAAGWTSWGNEVLKFQTADRFVVKGGGHSPDVEACGAL